MGAGVDETDDHDADSTVEALYRRADAFRDAHRWHDALNDYERLLVRLDAAAAPRLRRRAAVARIRCLDESGDNDATVAACDEFVTAYRGDCEAGLITDVLWMQSRALNRSGERERERNVLQRLITEFEHESPALGPVAGAMYNEAVYLRDDGRGNEAVALWDRLWVRSSKDWPASIGFIPVRGQLEKSKYLARTGQLDRALLTCEQMLKECHRRSLPDHEVRDAQRRCVSVARHERGIVGRLRKLL